MQKSNIVLIFSMEELQMIDTILLTNHLSHNAESFASYSSSNSMTATVDEKLCNTDSPIHQLLSFGKSPNQSFSVRNSRPRGRLH